MPPNVRSDGWPTIAADDTVVEAIADAMLATGQATRGGLYRQAAIDAWHHAGIASANHLIDHHPECVQDELAEAEREWDIPVRIGPHWTALIAGYRDTLREYTNRGDDR